MKIYLLSIEELQDKKTQALYDQCLRKMDTHRLEKVRKLKAENARKQAIGAGQLLQFAWADCVDAHRKWTGESGIEIVALHLSDLLKRLASESFPVEIPYQYGDKGKPDFAEGDYHFSLSHSGDYVCLAVDKKQIGIDIQKMRPLKDLKVAERFFTIQEQEALQACAEKQAQERLFYTIWVKKEAYAKLTGEGIAVGVQTETLPEVFAKTEMLADAPHVCGGIKWDMPQAPAGYRMAVCQLQNES